MKRRTKLSPFTECLNMFFLEGGKFLKKSAGSFCGIFFGVERVSDLMCR